MAEIGDDEGILGNDFAMAHELTVRPCEGAVYLPDHTGTGRGHLGKRLPCTIRVVTGVRTVTDLPVRAVGPATLAPHTVSQVRVIVPTPRAQGTVMVDQEPEPLGLCPVRGIVEVEQASNIWLANPGSQAIQIDGDEVVALAECVLAEPGASAGSDRDVGDEVNGLVERASLHLTSEECRQLQTAMAARKHLFAKGKGDLGRTDIVQHQIHTGDQPAIKQRVRRYPAARREEERQLVEDMLGQGAEHRGGDGEEPRRIELKKFSLRPEKYDCKVDFEGWVNQFEEYATLGQWTEGEKSSLLFLSLTAGARMYFVGLPEREKMAYATRVEALRRRFGQETDTSIALQELAGLRRGKNKSAKELADSARRLASHSNDYASQEKAALHAFQTAVGEDLQLKCAERSCRTLEMAVETMEIQERYTKKAVRALKQEETWLCS